nr:polynucleotide adenylyltransferase family protein [Tanacetum cinerariifolium]
MMEIDYMLSYGAAESSIRLLQRFRILEILLPFQAAYISRQTTEYGESPMMLMKLLSHLDKIKRKSVQHKDVAVLLSVPDGMPKAQSCVKTINRFEAYLVGGCVRDLILNRIPKDFDVITTADLHQVKKQFHRSVIVGRRFPICRVSIKGSVIEVSSFKTLAKHSEDKERFLQSQMPKGCDKSDLKLWKNSMHRDFTVNSNPEMNIDAHFSSYNIL